MDVSPVVMLCVDEDLDRARDLARPWLTVYLGGMGAKGKNFYVEAAERFGQGDAAREVQRLYMTGERAAAAACAHSGADRQLGGLLPPAELDDRLARLRERGRHDAARDAVRRPPRDRRPARLLNPDYVGWH